MGHILRGYDHPTPRILYTFFSLEPAAKESKISQSLLITMQSMDKEVRSQNQAKGMGKGKAKEGSEDGGSLGSGKAKMSAKKLEKNELAGSNIFLIKSLKAEVKKEGEKLVINFPGESFPLWIYRYQ